MLQENTISASLDTDRYCMFYIRASTVDHARKAGKKRILCLISFKTSFIFVLAFGVYSYLWRTANVCGHSRLFWNKKANVNCHTFRLYRDFLCFNFHLTSSCSLDHQIMLENIRFLTNLCSLNVAVIKAKEGNITQSDFHINFPLNFCLITFSKCRSFHGVIKSHKFNNKNLRP